MESFQSNYFPSMPTLENYYKTKQSNHIFTYFKKVKHNYKNIIKTISIIFDPKNVFLKIIATKM